MKEPSREAAAHLVTAVTAAQSAQARVASAQRALAEEVKFGGCPDLEAIQRARLEQAKMSRSEALEEVRRSLLRAVAEVLGGE